MADDCGCCAGVAVETPAMVANRDGLSAIAYRVGTHASFSASMRARLAGSTSPLAGLTTRDTSDFTIALLDAWATTLDVLTFYQERIANESYLRTATERLSLLELSREIGYVPRPAVASSSALAFTLDNSPGAPSPITIAVGVKVQSVPGPGETPHVFETIAAIEARREWSAIRPRPTSPQALSASASRIWIDGTDANLKAGDRVLIVTPVDRALRRVARVRPDNDNNRTSIDFEPLSDVPQTAASSESGVFVMRVKAAPFGHNAPLQIVGNTNGVPVMAEWDLAEPGEHLVTLDAVYDQIVAPSWVVIDRPSTFGVSLVQIVTTATQVRTLSRAAYGISARASQLTLEASWLSLPFVLGGVLTSQLSASGKMSASFGGVLGQGFLVDVLNVRVFDLSLSVLRDTVVYAQSERLTLSEQPLDGVVSGGTLELDGAYPGLDKNRHLAISGERVGGGLTSEIATIAAASTTSGVTTLTLEQGLANSYVRRTVVINANVSPATEGETVAEVLGSGDATASYQEFSLRQPPLTFVSASTPDGFASTLGVRVTDVAWHEAPTLYGRGPAEHVYVTRTEDDERTIVQFGNGAGGARLPSGSDNVRAVYRKGGGRGGNLDADRLSVLMTRPLGVTGVTNPEAATGGVDRQSRDDVRANAPLTMLTLDRIVSLRDYEDFARAFAGIAKALATWTWDGQTRGVFVTIAGADGAEVPEASDTYANLLAAMRSSGDPQVSLRVRSYRQRLFRLTARITRHPDWLAERVRHDARDALVSRFGFSARSFGQRVALSEVMAVIQTVSGVVGVDVDAIFRTDLIGGSGLLSPLPSAVPAVGSGSQTEPAELLLIDEAGVQIVVE
jgi:uncharacterized phage protein gp47/JayE